MKNNKNYDLIIKSKIWEADNHELVDYDNPYFIKKYLKVNSSGILYRRFNEIFLSKEDKERNILLKIKKNDNNYSYKIDCGKFSKDLNSLSNEDPSFIVFKSDFFKDPKTVKDRFYKLNQGDIIKVGRIYLKLLDYEINEEASTDKNKDTSSNNDEDKKSLIRNFSQNSSIIKGQEVIKGTFINDNNRLRINADLSNINSIENNCILSNRNRSNNSNLLNMNVKNKNNFILPRINSSEELLVIKHKKNQKKENSKNIKINHHKIKKLEKNRVCRICYGEDSSKENPLIYPCICKGSMKYIHYLCLKNWLNSKVESMDQYSDENTIISYNTKDICCELCKAQFPDYIRYKEKLYNITFYKPNFKEFLVFESLRYDRNSNSKTRYINIISFDNKKFINLGRSNKCDFSIPEISLSRFHSLIYKIKGDLYIEDNKSKFGTLILVQNNNIEINNYMPLKLQIARTYIKIKKDLPLFYSCCNSNIIDDNKLDYQEQNQKYLNVFSYFNIKDNKDNFYESESSEEEKDNNIIINNSNKNNEDEQNERESSINDLDETDHGPQPKNLEKSSSNNNIKKEENGEKEDKVLDINNAKEDIKDNRNISNIEIINNNNDKINKNQNNKNENNEMHIYNNKENIDNIIKAPSFNNINLNNNSRTSLEDLSNDTLTIRIKKNNNINLIIEDCNNKCLINNNENSNNNISTKTMKKIKIVNNTKNKDEFVLPDINDLNKINKKNIEPLENLININQFHPNQNKGINTISHQDTNLNTNSNNIFNINKNQLKITINKKNFFFFNSNQILVNNNNESFLNQNASEHKEKRKDDEKEEQKEK